ncbi:DUF1993 domain-containing protein [Azospirillum rugosum]|uniref:DUF1993 domain-containing protein n=1 Tax=Azospirillum rugosum TaxID=416170 RepID=A0ABS4SMG2_9PROT|nr:DUF1993 domain-containing protein [Azospirillum rugosum]MBP2293739.1 hypothetical protein [Azospirillum rugosum]MDQ0527284.1 hypothetical protein [Azospirillum rugosum]
MSLSLYRTSVPVFVRGLTILSTLLDKGAGHAAEQGLDPSRLIDLRLAPDMFPLTGQVQRASDTAKFAVHRVTGLAAPRFEDNEASFPELQERVAKTIDFLRSVDPAAVEAGKDREITHPSGALLRADDYLLMHALPNFFFHITTAYDLLRHAGVTLSKTDYLGSFAHEDGAAR